MHINEVFKRTNLKKIEQKHIKLINKANEKTKSIISAMVKLAVIGIAFACIGNYATSNAMESICIGMVLIIFAIEIKLWLRLRQIDKDLLVQLEEI